MNRFHPGQIGNRNQKFDFQLAFGRLQISRLVGQFSTMFQLELDTCILPAIETLLTVWSSANKRSHCRRIVAWLCN
jgi:hypothetical protein